MTRGALGPDRRSHVLSAECPRPTTPSARPRVAECSSASSPRTIPRYLACCVTMLASDRKPSILTMEQEHTTPCCRSSLQIDSRRWLRSYLQQELVHRCDVETNTRARSCVSCRMASKTHVYLSSSFLDSCIRGYHKQV